MFRIYFKFLFEMPTFIANYGPKLVDKRIAYCMRVSLMNLIHEKWLSWVQKYSVFFVFKWPCPAKAIYVANIKCGACFAYGALFSWKVNSLSPKQLVTYMFKNHLTKRFRWSYSPFTQPWPKNTNGELALTVKAAQTITNDGAWLLVTNRISKNRAIALFRSYFITNWLYLQLLRPSRKYHGIYGADV